MFSEFNELEISNFELFRDCLSTPLIENSIGVPQKTSKKRKSLKVAQTVVAPDSETPTTSDAEELGEFIYYIAMEVFACLPEELRSLEYYTWSKNVPLHEKYSLPLTSHDMSAILLNIAPHIEESLVVYGVLNSTYTLDLFLLPVMNSYLTSITTPPPLPSQTKEQATGCEICGRDWVPLTYHHLIPRSVHARVLKRGWHREDQLNNVAWLCRACHSFVHRVATNEELAKEHYSVELLMERDDVVKFSAWVGRVRWKTR